MNNMQYTKYERIDLANHETLNEKWVQQIIAEDPSILRLGDLILKDKERMQPGAGRLDLLLQDPDSNRRYEVEVQRGGVEGGGGRDQCVELRIAGRAVGNAETRRAVGADDSGGVAGRQHDAAVEPDGRHTGKRAHRAVGAGVHDVRHRDAGPGEGLGQLRRARARRAGDDGLAR